VRKLRISDVTNIRGIQAGETFPNNNKGSFLVDRINRPIRIYRLAQTSTGAMTISVAEVAYNPMLFGFLTLAARMAYAPTSIAAPIMTGIKYPVRLNFPVQGAITDRCRW
jgi:hypothetical protein